MIKVELLESLRDVYDLKFLDSDYDNVKVVCPGPGIADNFGERNCYKGSLEAMTINRFVTDQLKLSDFKGEVSRKVDLTLELATVWEKYFSDLPVETFHQAFNLLTELRSFTLDLSLIFDVLDDFDESISNAVKIFWKHMIDHEVIDEHSSYNVITESCVNRKKNSSTAVLFWGFSHLSSVQIDMINSLSNCYDLYIPFSQSVYEEASTSDWITWLLPKAVDYKGKFQKNINELKVIEFPKKRLSDHIYNINSQLGLNAVDVFLATKTPSFNEIMTVPISELNFQASASLFESQLNDSFKMLEAEVIEETLATAVTIVEKNIEKLIEIKDFKLLKIAMLQLSSLKSLITRTSEDEKVTEFKLNILKQCVLLNLPRNYMRPTNKKNIGSVRGLESLDSFDENKNTYLCISRDFPSILSASEKYSQRVLELLNAIGPIRRGEFESILIKDKIIELLNSNNSYLFLERGMDESDQVINDLFKRSQKITNLSKNNLLAKQISDPLKKLINSSFKKRDQFSASSLQQYIECKRKYYFAVLDKLRLNVDKQKSVTPMEIGIMEHSIIEIYLKDNLTYDKSIHLNLIHDHLQQALAEKGIELSPLEYDSLFIELSNYSGNGIKALLKFKLQYDNVSFIFEFKETLSSKYIGSIDVIVKYDERYAVFDFKRSSNSIPNKRSIDDFKKIQLWFYMNNFKIDIQNIEMWGYLNLSDIQNSLVIIEPDFRESVLELDLLDGGKMSKPKSSIKETIKLYNDFQVETIKSIDEEVLYPPNPISESVCSFCNVSSVCPRIQHD